MHGRVQNSAAIVRVAHFRKFESHPTSVTGGREKSMVHHVTTMKEKHTKECSKLPRQKLIQDLTLGWVIF
jgi:hypothetical protein